MATTTDVFRAAIRRRAICMDIGGFRPPDDPMTSWFGRVGFALPGEEWPSSDGRPIHALWQINVADIDPVGDFLGTMAAASDFPRVRVSGRYDAEGKLDVG